MIAAPVLERQRSPRTIAAGRLYGRLLASAADHVFEDGPPPPRACLRSEDGQVQRLPVVRWVEPVDSGDEAIIAGLEGPVLDIGCGPGRHVAELLVRGVRAVGVDLSPVAVRVTRERGGEAVFGSVFAEVPNAGGWRTALLLDGNIGVGGDPALLLGRVRELLAPGGVAVVELDAPGMPSEQTRVRLEAPGVISEWFRWARVGTDGIGSLAAAAGLRADPPAHVGDRWYVHLHRP